MVFYLINNNKYNTMIILRKMFSLSETIDKNRRKVERKPEGLENLNPNRKTSANTLRWKRFNKETGGNKWRINAGKTRKEFNAWQLENYGDTIYGK